MQIDFREVFLKILEQCGLRRSQGGSAIVLTGQDAEEHVYIENAAAMPIPELTQQYTVRTCSEIYLTGLNIAD